MPKQYPREPRERGSMRFRVLGAVEVFDGCRWRRAGTAKQRTLLAELLINVGSVVSRDRLTDELWGDDPPAGAANQVYGNVARLRKLVGDPEGKLLVTHSPGYRLSATPCEIDSGRFEELAEDGRRALAADRFGEASERLAEALGLWHGRAYADVPATGAVRAEVNRLEEERLSAQAARIDADLALGRHDGLVAELMALTQTNPLRERAWKQLMLALYRCGRQADALEAYRRAHRVLGDELGITPGPALQRLHQRILDADPSLETSVTERAGAADPGGADGVVEPSTVLPRQLPADVANFTGRVSELGRLDALAAGDADTVVICAITGTAGIGKTALALRWAHRAASRFTDGQLHIDLRGFATTAPVSPLDALIRMLRALGVPPERIPADIDEAAALYRSLLAGRRALVMLDNAATAEQVRPLLPGSPGCLVLITSRDRLTGLTARDGAVRLTLDALSPAEARLLLDDLLGSGRLARESAAAGELAAGGAHMPLALRIAAARLADQPHRRIADYVAELGRGDPLAKLTLDDGSDNGIRIAFDLSYRTLDADARRLFRRFALVPGTDIAVDAVAALDDAGRDRAYALLETLARGHLVEPRAPGRYGMHDLLAAYAADRTTHDDPEPERRAALDRLLAWYLEHIDGAAQRLVPGVSPGTRGTDDQLFTSQPSALAWLEAEYANLAALIDHVVSNNSEVGVPSWFLGDARGGYLWLRQHLSEWPKVVHAEGGRSKGTHGARAQAAILIHLADLCAELGHWSRATTLYRKASTTSRRAGWPEGVSASGG